MVETLTFVEEGWGKHETKQNHLSVIPQFETVRVVPDGKTLCMSSAICLGMFVITVIICYNMVCIFKSPGHYWQDTDLGGSLTLLFAW